MKNHKIKIGSRGSELALWQANWVKAELEKQFPRLSFEVEIIKTKGDKVLDSSLSKIGSKGIFTREIDFAILEKRIDLAVHSLKDIPTELPEGLMIGAVTKREDVRDVFLAHPKKKYSSLDDLPQQAKIATGSLRRKCQLLRYRPDVQIMEIRGNVPTRVQKLDVSDWDGMILAKAGITRLGLAQRITQVIPTEIILPAVSQGAIAVEIREGDSSIAEIVSTINSWATEMSTKAERALLRHLEGGCQVPIGAFGRIESDVFHLDAMIGSLDGKTVARSSISGNPEEAESLAMHLAKTLLQIGGEKILREIRSSLTAEVPSV